MAGDSRLELCGAGVMERFQMSNTLFQVDRGETSPSLIPDQVERLTDDECLSRLAQAVTEGESEQLDELARLLGRLAVVIE